MRFVAVKLWLVMLLCMAGCATGPPVVPLEHATLSAMAEGERIAINFRSDGCFHHARFLLTIKPAKDGIRVSGVDLSYRYDRAQEKHVRNKDPSLTPLYLSHAEVLKLDKMLEYYRARPSDGVCTTTDEITITRYLRGLQKSETFTDDTCGSRFQEGLLDFFDVVVRMK